jgi:hypothetical protein
MCRKLFILCLVIGVSCISYAQQQDAVIRVVQDQSEILSDFQNTIRLKRKPFKFQILLKNVDGVFVFASVRDSVYRFTENSPIQDFSYLKLLELRDEDVFNSNKELNLSETGWSYWFYSPTAEWHPFNRKVIWLDSNEAVCTKQIKQLFDIGERKTIKIRDIQSPLYMLFIAVAEYDATGRPMRELMRRKVKIEWDDTDDD